MINQKEIRTERLILRELRRDDALAIYSLRSNSIVNKYLDRECQKSVDDALSFIDKISKGAKSGDWYYWAICLGESEKLIGTICIWNISEDRTSAELGYELLPMYQKKGYMNESMQGILFFAIKELSLRKLIAYTNINNEASRKLLEKFDFIKTTALAGSGNAVSQIYEKVLERS